MHKEHQTLSHFIDCLQAKGQYFLSKRKTMQLLDVTDGALRSSIKRLVKKKRLFRLKQDLYMIIPLEYRNIGAPPPEWFIDYLMKAYKARYYVGLLTAASLHGASHQQSQIYQVITDKPLRSLKIGRARIKFYLKKDFHDTALVKKKTSTGYICVSNPELTAFDLIQYLKQSGHINHVSTVLAELGEEINAQRLSKIAKYYALPCIQRTGYILDLVGFVHKTKHLLKYVHRFPARYYPLRPDKKWNIENKNTNWHLYINEQLEPDI